VDCNDVPDCRAIQVLNRNMTWAHPMNRFQEADEGMAMLSGPEVLLRIEHAVVLAVVVYIYHSTGAGWGLFALLFLWPDLGMLGYLANVKIGAALYNISHITAFPAVLAVYSFAMSRAGLLAFSLTWLAHIECDRVIGYGLKYPTSFKDTHLQQLNRLRPSVLGDEQ
jgi:hypothetical protein